MWLDDLLTALLGAWALLWGVGGVREIRRRRGNGNGPRNP